MSQSWIKQGIVFPSQFAQMPVFSQVRDEIVISFSKRDENNSSYGEFLNCVINNKNELSLSKSLHLKLLSGDIGDTDAAGVMPMQIIKNKLFYIGWTTRLDVPYFNYTSVASIQKHNFLRKLGPILSPCIIDNGFSGTLHVIPHQDFHYIGYYLSCVGWYADEDNKIAPGYDLKIATSKDLLTWHKTGKVAIELAGDQGGISSATVIKTKSMYHMWYSVRKKKFFRGGLGSYVIKHSCSIDGLKWYPTNEFGLVPEIALKENMCAYPTVMKYGDFIHMLYNGCNFGVGGFSHALLPINAVSKFEEYKANYV